MKIIFALIFMLTLNMLLFFSQLSVDAMATDSGVSSVKFFNYDNSLIAVYDAGNYTLDDELTGKLPSGQGQIEPESGNFFTDTFATVKNWFLGVTGLNYLTGIVTAFPNFLKMLGLPLAVSFGLGFLWYAIALFLVVAFISGKT